MHPNSLANLKPPYQVGHPPLNPAGSRGPLITPSIRRFAQMPTAKLLALDPLKLTVAEALARTRILAALSIEDGARDRDSIEDRLDGKVKEIIETRQADDDPWLAIVKDIRGEAQKMLDGNGATS